ncbi:hypothetical protein QBC32DRAFT_94156 [Pseudoneurospora amorphoporcata]|uniref:Uncharacterized protein n=1 Tax=Pseudoneurospora amorphoporcata TaxID=241081 RepID=A0AAN6NNC2_9PEZI|nr:hypothetical protein QBC32DRAFT_94156 [Pseudoneurospora amorphoporcata]
MGFRDGSVVRFWINAFKGVKLTELHHIWASSTSLWEVVKALFRWKALPTVLLTIVFTVANIILSILWSHSMYVPRGRNNSLQWDHRPSHYSQCHVNQLVWNEIFPRTPSHDNISRYVATILHILYPRYATLLVQ